MCKNLVEIAAGWFPVKKHFTGSGDTLVAAVEARVLAACCVTVFLTFGTKKDDSA